MQAADREARQRRWEVWHTAALPLMKRMPSAESFIDPKAKASSVPEHKTFWALRSFNTDAPPDWVVARFTNNTADITAQSS